MSCVFITSDLHLGHKNITKYRPSFISRKEHDECILDNITDATTKRDTLYILGDCAFSMEPLLTLKKIPCTKILILGNHDTDRDLAISDIFLSGVFKEIHGLHKFKKVWLSHAPIHPQELRGKVNIHGHVHAHSIPDTRYINVCVERTNFSPVKYQELLVNIR